MKKIYHIFIFVLILFTGCKNDNHFELTLDLNKNSNDTILVVQGEPLYKLDTLVTQNGKSTYKIPIDTFTIITLIIDHNKEIPVFANKGEKLSVKKDKGTFIIKGSPDNEKIATILNKAYELKNDTPKIQKWSEQFIKENSASYASIFLIKNYFVQSKNPDIKQIDRLYRHLKGNIKDTDYMISLSKELNSKTGDINNNYINNVPIPDTDGKILPWNILNDKYTLISFWASWDKESKVEQDSISSLLKKIKNNKFQVISISLDYNEDAWKKSITTEEDNWMNVCNFQAWENSFVKQQNISSLPYCLLIGPDKKIIAKDTYVNNLKSKFKDITE